MKDIEQLDKDYKEGVVQDGLTSRQSYVILANNFRLGAHLGLRPFAHRVDENTIWLGGRLRTAFDFDDEAHQTKKPKAAKLERDAAIETLKDEFPNLVWMTASDMRCSTTVGILIAAGIGDSKKFQKMWDEIDYIDPILVGIEALVKVPLVGVTKIKNGRNKCYDSLTRKWEAMLWQCFGEPGQQSMLKKGVLGEVSQLLNEGNQRSYEGQVQDFRNKVIKEQAKST